MVSLLVKTRRERQEHQLWFLRFLAANNPRPEPFLRHYPKTGDFPLLSNGKLQYRVRFSRFPLFAILSQPLPNPALTAQTAVAKPSRKKHLKNIFHYSVTGDFPNLV